MIIHLCIADLRLPSSGSQSEMVKHVELNHVLDTIFCGFWTEFVHRGTLQNKQDFFKLLILQTMYINAIYPFISRLKRLSLIEATLDTTFIFFLSSRDVFLRFFEIWFKMILYVPNSSYEWFD